MLTRIRQILDRSVGRDARFGPAKVGSGAKTLSALYEKLAQIEQAALIKSTIREDTTRLREAAEGHFGQCAELPEAERHRLMHDLPTDPVEAMVQLGLRLVTNKRLRAGWYADRLIFLVNVEKSSSTLHEIAIREMQLKSLGQEPNFGIQHGLKFGPTEVAYGSLHGLLPLYAPDGGVLRGPFQPTFGNIRYVQELGARVALLCRHPADRLVARGCMAGASVELMIDPEDVESGEVFHRLIHDYWLPPSLNEELKWLTGWLDQLGDWDRLHLLRYEDMMADPHAHFDRLHHFVTGQSMGSELWTSLQDKISRSSGGDLQPGSRAERTYPKGYSGKVGVWRDYFSADHIKEYNAVVQRFLDYHPRGDLLCGVYPDILIG